jgi:hypothetical protein
MFARTSMLGMLAAATLSLPPGGTPSFHLDASGAVNLTIASDESSYGLTPEKVNGGSILAISMGATRGEGSLALYTQGGQLPKPGRYPVHFSWPEQGDSARIFHACFIAGTPEHPLGAFHGESGVVTITEVDGARVSGEFELRARGSLASNMADEDQWVTVRGSFVADGDSTAAGLQTVSSR